MAKSVGIGITTYNRPEALSVCLESVLEHAPKGAKIFINDDGSDVDYGNLFDSASESGVKVFRAEHANIATSKNRLLTGMMNEGVDHLFLVEDDMQALSPRAFSKYIDASVTRKVHHAMFAHHGTRNREVSRDADYSYHFECVGSWCHYTSHAIETVGLMDENFENCWEHVVHSLLIALASLMPSGGWRRWPDIKESINLIAEIPSLSTHAEKTEEELMSEKRIQDGLKYWRDTYPFPEDVEALIQT